MRFPTTWVLTIALALVGGSASSALSASKRKVAAIGDAAPGGGVYAGPAFRSAPHAAGTGWVVFRTLVTDGSSPEVIIVANMVPTTATRIEVAHTGQQISESVGSIRQFLGRPTVNANGDVAFAVTINAPDPVPDANGNPPPLPLVENEAAVLLFRRTTGAIEVVALSGVREADLKLDIATPVDPFIDPGSTDITERTPALNDQGHVAFLASTFTGSGANFSAALFLWKGSGGPIPVLALDALFQNRPFNFFGPPALNNADVLAFRASVDPADSSEAEVLASEGIFTLSGTTTTRLAHGGVIVPPFEDPDLLDEFDDSQPLSEFGSAVAINDLGHVAFTAGPFFEPDPNSTSSADSPAVFVHRNGITTTVAYLGQEDDLFLNGEITGIALGDEGGNEVVPPVLDAAGDVIFVAELDDVRHAVVLAKAENLTDLREVIGLGGSSPDATPLGGFFSRPASAVAADAPGGVAIVARLGDAPVSEALAYEAATGEKSTIRLGEGVPNPSTGFLGGPPFASPLVTDTGDLVFMAHIVGGPSARGIFRYRDGTITPLVRIGDTVPNAGEGGAHFTDFDGNPSINASGEVAFTAVTTGSKRGVFVVRTSGIEAVARTGDVIDPPANDIGIVRIAANPAILDSGVVAFRATLDLPGPDPDAPFASNRQETLLAREGETFSVLATQGSLWPVDDDYFIDRIRDPGTAGGPAIAFRAPLAPTPPQTDPPRPPVTGLFVHDAAGLFVLAVENDFVEDAELVSLLGRPALDAAGNVAFLASISRGGFPESAVLISENFSTRIVADATTTGPAGGVFRGFGAPILSRNGRLAFRGSFELGTGGTPGFFRVVDGAVSDLLQVGEAVAELEAPAQGERTRFSRFSSFSPSGALASDDTLAFIGTVSSGSRRNGLFLASPASASVQHATVSLRTKQLPNDSLKVAKPRDRVTIRATLAVGGVSDGVDPANEPVTIWLSDAASLTDTGGAVYTATLPRGSLQARGKGKTLVLAPTDDTRKTIRSAKLAVGKNGIVKIALRSARLDFLNRFPGRLPTPPFRVRIQIGDDEAAVTVSCTGDTKIVCPAG